MHVSHALACTALRVVFEKNLYPVREDVGNLSYRLIAVSSKTASFPYEVIVTAVDGTAKCEAMHLRQGDFSKCYVIKHNVIYYENCAKYKQQLS